MGVQIISLRGMLLTETTQALECLTEGLAAELDPSWGIKVRSISLTGDTCNIITDIYHSTRFLSDELSAEYHC